jgi:predicted ribosomally synthesized peptide with SipW-like signal peptide
MVRESTPSARKLAALAVTGAVVVALAVAGGGATYAYLSDTETLGSADDPNVIGAASEITTREVTPDGSANTASGDCVANTATGNTGCEGGSASLVVLGVPAMVGTVREWSGPPVAGA